MADGRILRLGRDGRQVQVADTGGRPLGIEIDPDGGLVVCDCIRGLLQVDPATGAVDVLVDQFEGQRLKFCNN